MTWQESRNPLHTYKHSEKEDFLKYLLYLDSKNTLRASQGTRLLHSQQPLADLGGGVRDARPPLGVQILSISCSFRENLACSRPPWRVHAPPSGKSWIRHWQRHPVTPVSSCLRNYLQPGMYTRSPSRSLSSFSGLSGWGTGLLRQWGASGYGYTTHQHQHSATLAKLEVPSSFENYFAFYPCKYCRLTYVYHQRNKSSFVPDEMDSLLPMLVKAQCSALHCRGSSHRCETPLHSVGSSCKDYVKLNLSDKQKVPVYRSNGYKSMVDLAVGVMF